MSRPKTLPAERFERFVEKSEGCWLWTGTTVGSNARYGHFWDGERKVYAHRFAYELWVGPIPEGHEIDHVKSRGCTSKLCVRPDHLEPVTHRENRRRGRLEVCRSGRHDLTVPENVLWDPKGQRRGCAVCSRERALARYHRGKERP